MAFVAINPRYRDFLRRRGLVRADQFLALTGVILSGHPDRHVAQVRLGEGASALGGFLKREHRVPWKERLASAWAGFGFVSRSGREAKVLQALSRAGIPCPEYMAVGEDGRGRAFLLVREVAGAIDLRSFLRDRLPASPRGRRQFSAQLGQALARLHNAGFNHPDLSSKHVLVSPCGRRISFVDWQRARRWRHLSWRRRLHDLAVLHATVADDLASPRERLVCLQSYLRVAAGVSLRRLAAAGGRLIEQIRRHGRRLLHRRHLRELLQTPLPMGAQHLIRLQGEGLCVTREFQSGFAGQVPPWLTAAQPPAGANPHRMLVPMPGGRKGLLVRRWTAEPVRRLWSWLRRRPPKSPGLESAALLFRLQRYGIPAPRLLAVGHRSLRWWRTASFVLTEWPTASVSLADWLACSSERPVWSAERKRRREVIREAAAVLRRMHRANCYGLAPPGSAGPPGGRSGWPALRVCSRQASTGRVVLASVEGMVRRRHASRTLTTRNLRVLCRLLAGAGCTRTDQLRFLFRYLDVKRLTPAARRLGRRVLCRPKALRLRRSSPWFTAPPSMAGYGLLTADHGPTHEHCLLS